MITYANILVDEEDVLHFLAHGANPESWQGEGWLRPDPGIEPEYTITEVQVRDGRVEFSVELKPRPEGGA